MPSKSTPKTNKAVTFSRSAPSRFVPDSLEILRVICSNFNLSSIGTKKALKKRLSEYYDSNPSSSNSTAVIPYSPPTRKVRNLPPPPASHSLVDFSLAPPSFHAPRVELDTVIRELKAALSAEVSSKMSQYNTMLEELRNLKKDIQDVKENQEDGRVLKEKLKKATDKLDGVQKIIDSKKGYTSSTTTTTTTATTLSPSMVIKEISSPSLYQSIIAREVEMEKKKKSLMDLDTSDEEYEIDLNDEKCSGYDSEEY